MNKIVKIGSNPDLYKFEVLDESEIVLESNCSNETNYGGIRQIANLDSVRGRRIRLTAELLTENVTHGAGLWLRASTHHLLVSDGMYDRLVAGTTSWTSHELIIDVPMDAEIVTYGVWMIGNGKCAMRHAVLDIVGKELHPTTKTVFGQVGPNSWVEKKAPPNVSS